MCCNRSNNNNNNNVQGDSGRRECCCRPNRPGNVGGATEIALRGPGCINGTGRCLRRNENVQGDSGMNNCWSWISPETGNSGNCNCGRNNNNNNNNNRNCCEWCFRCLRELLNDMNFTSTCPR